MFLVLGVVEVVVAAVVERVANLAELQNARDAESQFMRQRKLLVLARYVVLYLYNISSVEK